MARVLIALMVMTIFFEFASPFPDRRVQRHADGIFTSEFTKIMNDFATRNYLKKQLASKRSDPEMNFPDKLEDNETRSEEACFNWLHHNFLSESRPANDAEEAAAQSYKVICQVCQPLGRLLQSLEEYVPPVKSPQRTF